MKRIFGLLLALAVCAGVYGQDDPGKDLKKVTRNLANYNLDPAGNADALIESIDLIEGVVKSSEYSKDSKAWLAYGNVFAENINKQTQVLVLDENAPLTNPGAVQKAYEGYHNAVEYAEKGYEKKDAVNGLKTVLPNMYYMANVIINRNDLEAAYPAYRAVTMSDQLLKENGDEGIFKQEELQNAEFVTAVCAFSTGKNQEAINILEDLRKEDYRDAGVYEYLYKAYAAAGDDAKADEALEAGRKTFPGDKGLLFAEINATLAKGELEQLVNKLKLAVAAEPDNVSVPTTLGNVYDQLYQKSLADGDITKAHEFFDSAKVYTQYALNIKPDHFDAVYMMGALEYNRAAELAAEVNALADDYSKEGTKKYEAKKAEMMSQFDKALPYFQKAEQLNGTDTNTLLALREIWARKGDFEKSEMYKAKLEAAQGN